MAEDQAPELQAIRGRDVFISYASHDKAVAESVCKALENAGVVCWIAPRDVVPGESFAGAIVHAIDATKVIVLVLSEHSADSQHVLREVERASSKRHPVIAFRIDLAPMPADLEYFLNTSQWLDAGATGTARALPKLVDAVKSALALPTAAARVDLASAATTKSNLRMRYLFVALAVIVAVGIAASYAPKFWLAKHVTVQRPPTIATSVVSDKSIAILPFTDLSDTHDQEYFADGLAEEILDELAKVPQLRVISRTSSFQLKGQSADVRAVGAKLGVAHVLEGSVRQSAGNVRVTAQLIQTSDGAHEWSDTYDRPRSETLTLQRQIASQIASALDLTLRATTDDSGGTRNVEAHELYLRGIHVTGDSEKIRHEQATEYFRRALEMDPSYQAAAEGLLWSRLVLVDDGFGEPENWEQVRAAAQSTLQRFPRSADAHLALARVYEDHDWNWEAAREEVGLAQRLGSTGNADFELAAIEGLLGQWTKSVQLWRRVLLTDPLSSPAHRNLGADLQSSQQYREAANEFQRALEIDPNVPFSHSGLAGIYLVLAQPESALHEAQMENSVEWRQIALACVQFRRGHERESRAAVETLVHSREGKSPYAVAATFACRGNADQAFEWLERALTARDPEIAFIKSDWPFDGIKKDSRYVSLLRQLNLPN